jgi:hypothetical protein
MFPRKSITRDVSQPGSAGFDVATASTRPSPKTAAAGPAAIRVTSVELSLISRRPFFIPGTVATPRYMTRLPHQNHEGNSTRRRRWEIHSAAALPRSNP